MSVKRSRPGSPAVRHGAAVGPDYPVENYHNPFNMGIEEPYGDGDDKSLTSPSGQTVTGAGAELHHSYDKYWEGK